MPKKELAEGHHVPPKNANQEKIKLALELLRRIPRGRKVTAEQLHKQLSDAGIQRDLRTIQRQLKMLCEQFEIECDDRAQEYGYSWLPDARGLALSILTPKESLLLKLAQEQLKHLLPARLMSSLDTFFKQANINLLTQNHAFLEREWAQKVRVVDTTQPLLAPALRENVFENVSEALYLNRWLNLDYQNVQGVRREVQVMPLGLAQQGPRLYLVCRFRGYDNERSLALHRIHSAEVSGLSFERPKDFDLKKYDDEGRFGFGHGKKIKLHFFIRATYGQHLLESPLSTDQHVVKHDDSLEITATVVESDMLNWWLRGFGEAVWGVTKEEVVQSNEQGVQHE